MRAQLRNGKLIPPRSITDGARRLKQLDHEMANIERQLEDSTRVLRYPSCLAYDMWQTGAKRALRLFQEEARQINEWMANQNTAEGLLREAYSLLQVLQQDVDFEPEEQTVMGRLEQYFTSRGTEHGQRIRTG